MYYTSRLIKIVQFAHRLVVIHRLPYYKIVKKKIKMKMVVIGIKEAGGSTNCPSELP